MKQEIVLGWLYPELMSTYGDRGNIIVLKNRCLWRNIGIKLIEITSQTSIKSIQKCDLIFGGGAQDRQQTILIDDLRTSKGPILQNMFHFGKPGLFVCGAPQLLGHSYMTGDGNTLVGLGIFDMETRHFGKNKPRCIGNLVTQIDETYKINGTGYKNTIVGFENHGGRTYLGKGLKPFAKVLFGYGNNGEDMTEGAILNNCIATYSHGPFLSKNPHIADWLLSKSLEIKYKKVIDLQPLDDALEWSAHESILSKLLLKHNS